MYREDEVLYPAMELIPEQNLPHFWDELSED